MRNGIIVLLMSLAFTNVSFAKVNINHELYAKFVKNGQYQNALNLVCRAFRNLINCKKVKIVNKLDGSYAITWNYTNNIKIAKSSFEHYTKNPANWLAIIIAHENVHQRQNMVVRQYAGVRAKMGNHYWQSTLEIEAWSWMRNNYKKFNLDDSALYEIDDNLDYYLDIFSNDGKLPEDEKGLKRLPPVGFCNHLTQEDHKH